jgi:protein-S-isoprenylcysteine O-methyltransferase Ste14
VSAAGGALVAAGFVLRAWSLRTLGRFYSPVVEIRPDHRVVEDGPYKYVRHPGYLAGLMQATGVGLGFGTTIGTTAIAGSWLSAFIPRIREEEAALHDALGADYQQFCQNRPRLVPYIW